MSNTLSNNKRLNLLLKPLHLFLAQDVQADLETKTLITEEWEKDGCYYVAQLLASSNPLVFLHVHIALKNNGFAIAQFASLENLLPEIIGENEEGRLAYYEEKKPDIYRALGSNAVLWADEDVSLSTTEHKQAAHKIFSVHFKEADLLTEGIDIGLAESLFQNAEFRMDFSNLMRAHAARLKAISTLHNFPD